MKRRVNAVMEYTCDRCQMTKEEPAIVGWTEIITMVDPPSKEVTVNHLCVDCSKPLYFMTHPRPRR